MSKRLFGTDGVRAVAGNAPLDPPGVRKIGAALAEVLKADGSDSCRVALGMDTRESGPWLRDAVSAGLAVCGAHAVDAGVITTPGLAYVVKSGGFDAGVMISASHNPFQDNGLKVFGSDGMKLPDENEKRIESLVLDGGLEDPGESDRGAEPDGDLRKSYVEHLEELIQPRGRFRGLRLVLDCANGSASGIAPEAFRHHGAEVHTLGDAPDGRNINLDCGSLHLDKLAETVTRGGFDAGLAFDGDADRCLVVDRKGREIDGDHILYIAGMRLKQKGELRGNALVATIMSNFWLEEQLGHEGIRLLRAPVGDKYVLERMIQEDLVLGGEQSGHIIFRDLATTGDGVLTGLLLVDTLLDERKSLDQIVDGIEPYPQLLINVRVREKPDLSRHPVVGPVVSEVESALEGQGRLVLRYSGTEPLARVMIEGKDQDAVRQNAERLATVIERELGA
jgi:phosphoglucosamine mutase